ncbi:hypothetical protein KI387_042979, partial [Taxus chinensis]
QELTAICDFLSLTQVDKLKYLTYMKEEGLMNPDLEQWNPSVGHPPGYNHHVSSMAMADKQATALKVIGGVASGLPSGGTVSSKSTTSFKDTVKHKSPSPPLHLSYIVDLAEEIPLLSLEKPKVLARLHSLSQLAVIGRFNGMWPSSSDLSL